MKLLALETSTEYCSVALWQDGTIDAQRELVGQKHSERLLAMVDEVLNTAGVRLAQLHGIAFGHGPGSFTGVRIACGVAQGLALGADLKVCGISTLLALAEASGHDQVIAALDARMNEFYLAAYEKVQGNWQTVSEPRVCKLEDAPQLSGKNWYGVGSGFALNQAAWQARYAGQWCGVNAEAVPEAGAIARLAVQEFVAGRQQDIALALPVYLRDKVAFKTIERELKKSVLNHSVT